MPSLSLRRPPQRPSRPAPAARLNLEELEGRNLLSVAGTTVAPQIDVLPLAATSAYQVYSPGQVRSAYGFDRVPWTGVGQTIAIVVTGDDPNIANDLAVFDANFNLPGQSVAQVNTFLTKVNQYIQPYNLPAADVGWSEEIALDVEWAHAVAPQANIMLVETNSSNSWDIMQGVIYARYQPNVSVVSMSFGGGEFYGEWNYDPYFSTPPGHGGVTFVAAAGDSGAGAEWPSISTNVLAVGGTSLHLDPYTSQRQSETAWNYGGGGISQWEARPVYQYPYQGFSTRTSPDVSYDADPSTGYYVFDSYGMSGWYAFGGTSAAAPQWAGLIALANNARAFYGRPSLDNALGGLYALPPTAFNDITVGSNGYGTLPGYDLASGRGTPIANQVIAGLLTYGYGPTPAGVAAPPVGYSGIAPRVLGGPVAAPTPADPAVADPSLAAALPATPSQPTPAGDALWQRPFEAPRPAPSQAFEQLAQDLARSASAASRPLLDGGGDVAPDELQDAVWRGDDRPSDR